MKRVIAISSLVMCISCTSQPETKVLEPKVKESRLDSVPIKETVTPEMLFLFENDTLRQTVALKTITEKTVAFKLTSSNKLKNKTIHMKGTAQLKEGDLEIDEDEEGNGYPVDEYVYNQDSCFLALRLDAESKDKMTIKTGDCVKKTPDCPLSSLGILIKKPK